jgi:hypothetical protein
MRRTQQFHRYAGLARPALEGAKFACSASVEFLRIRLQANAAQAGKQLEQRRRRL